MSFNKLTAYLDSLAQVHVPARDLTVYRNHEMIYRHFSGFKDEAGTVPLNGDETYCLYSATKIATCCAAMQLIGDKKIDLDAPVAAYLPAYAHMTVQEGDSARPARTTMTIRHLMSMQGGLNYNLNAASIQEEIKRRGGDATTRQLIDALAREPLSFEPGEHFQYSLCHDVLAAVIEVASGQQFSDYLNEHIFIPLNMNTVTFRPTPELLSRQCAQYGYNSQRNALVNRPADDLCYRLTPSYESGGAGLISDARDYAIFADALACGGEGLTGAQVLTPELIKLWSTDQLGPGSRQDFDQWKRIGYSYALGVRTRVDTSIGRKGPLGEFGWDGAAGAWLFIDPVHQLSAFYAQHVRGYGYSYDVIHPALQNLIYEALGL